MIERSISLEFQHRVVFTRGAFEVGNRCLAELLGEDGVARTMVVLDSGVAGADPSLLERVRGYFSAHAGLVGLAGDPLVLAGGEACKNEWERVPDLWAEIHRRELDRHSYVLAVGGGALLDLVGFAAATAHRGIRHVRMPTTTLSQGDGGVGVKNGVNFFGKKNWVGTFTVPHAVVNDLAFLDTLPEREARAGIIEAIKVALIRDGEFFAQLERDGVGLAALDADVLATVIRRSAELHVDHIAGGGDPFELGSARPLDFGHWAAHKLEQISGFALGHGEAVAIGIAVDLMYAVEAGMMGVDHAVRVLDLIEQVGFAVHSDLLHARDDCGELAVIRGLEEFREHLGGELTITLVTEPGQSVEVHEIDPAKVAAAIARLHERALVGR